MKRSLCALAVLSAAWMSGEIQAAVVALTTPNTNSVVGPVTNTLNGTTFINLGLQGVGRIPASSQDQFGDTLGSVSSMNIAGWRKTRTGYAGTFYTLPDRGYNAGTFFSDFAARIQRIDFTFTPYTGTAPIGGITVDEMKAAQDQIKPTYSGGELVTLAGDVTTTGLDPGTNVVSLFGDLFPFVPTQTIGGVDYPVSTLALDSEALVLKRDGSGWIADEYGPNIYYFDCNRQIVGAIVPPPGIRPHVPAGTLNFNSNTAPTNGRRNNQGFEGLDLNPDGTKLFVLLQSATIQDSGSGNQGRLNTRLLVYDVSESNTPDSPIAEYALQLPIVDETGTGRAPSKTCAQSEMLVLSDCQVLILARDSNGLGPAVTNQAVYKSILLADLSSATDVAGSTADDEGGRITASGVLLPTITPMSWVEAVNMLNLGELSKFNINVNNSAPNGLTLSEKWEALSLVPAYDWRNPNDYFLFVANDNDFITANGTMFQADGLQHPYDAVGTNPLVTDNDTVFLAYRVRILPDSIPPVITSLAAEPNVITPADRRWVPVTLDVEASDNCSLKRCRIVSVKSSDSRRRFWRDCEDRDAIITGDLTLLLRAESDRDGRIYTITVACRDDAGNRETATVEVTVVR
jgi:hypothetical protein